MSMNSSNEKSAAIRRLTRRKPGRERLLAAADQLFYRDGVASSVMDQLIEEAGVARGTLYGNFHTRDALVEAYLQGRHERTLVVLEHIAGGHSTLRHKVDAIFDYLESLTGEEMFRGCAFVIAAAELPDDGGPAVRWAKVHKQAACETFRQIFRDHHLSNPDLMAGQMSILYDGALVTSYIRPDSNAVQMARTMAHQLFLQGED